MGTIRRIRRHQHALILVAALFGAVAGDHAHADSFSVAAPQAATPPFVPQDCLTALPLIPGTDAQFAAASAALDAGAVEVATRADMDRLSAPAPDQPAAVAAATSGRPAIEERIILIFARFDGAEAETQASSARAARDGADFAAATRRWSPAVSQALFAFAAPLR